MAAGVLICGHQAWRARRTAGSRGVNLRTSDDGGRFVVLEAGLSGLVVGANVLHLEARVLW
jgi:hypothetical protein